MTPDLLGYLIVGALWGLLILSAWVQEKGQDR